MSNNGRLFGYIKEWRWSPDTYYNIDEPWKCKWKKPDAKGHMLYDFIYMKCPECIIHGERKQIIGYQRLGTGRG